MTRALKRLSTWSSFVLDQFCCSFGLVSSSTVIVFQCMCWKNIDQFRRIQEVYVCPGCIADVEEFTADR
ncbi:hypothetical protein CYLTODRAFT_422566 [Cylindrobasidium torrendii FP15055 ss-10]|uniref:Uncharacterized protein n=1 Tax=Cylindrobasidium torrendii FP15055 ss-10 TaxID=1314674 RepID=A0A0D7BA12_9AGAR|nr:hypothetical protein CYLTODRAFT_422566 [Cylindrobasidium torrendii FP15055 ss-10]